MSKQSKTYEIIVDESKQGEPVKYSRLSVKGKTEWKTKRTAEKHAREFKTLHLKDAWVQEAD